MELGPAAVDLSELKQAFKEELTRQADVALGQLTVRWSVVHDRLDTLSTPQLEKTAARLLHKINGKPDPVYDIIARETMVAWSNLVARAMQGGMAGWDQSATNGGEGAIALRSARIPTSDQRDPTGGNVDPKAMDAALVDPVPECSGVLEIAVDGNGRLIRGSGYGMHIRNVGEKVVKELSSLGTVRDARVNKLVRMYEPSDASWRMVASVLITADGYVRRTNWSEFANVVMPHHATTPWGAYEEKQGCFDDLIHGRQSADCHMDDKANERDIAAFAEKAQDLPLTNLEAT